jgi:ABC-type sugar transport system ATPase subunit
VPADRRGAAIVPSRSLRENLALSRRIRAAARRFGLRWHRRERAMMQGYVTSLDIRPGAIEARIATLSGGNQQKVALARVLEGQARVLLVEEPTQGIDVAAKAEIHRLLKQLAVERGCAVVIASSEFEELIGLADEIHVMRMGSLVTRIDGAHATYHQILEAALP